MSCSDCCPGLLQEAETVFCFAGFDLWSLQAASAGLWAKAVEVEGGEEEESDEEDEVNLG